MFKIITRPVSGRFFMVSGWWLFLGCVLAWGQKDMHRTYDARNLTKLQIDAERIFEVELHSATSDLLEVHTFIEGEYQNELTVTSEKKGSTLILKGDFTPSFQNPNDKLSAHKVVSVRLSVKVPVHLIAEIVGSSVRVQANGFYEDLSIQTGKGPVLLEEVEGLIRVKTLSGEIVANRISGVLNASSSYGEVFRGHVRPGNSQLDLESVSGDIYINNQE